MSESDSVTRWIEDLKQGDEDAAARLWQRYFDKMVQAARQKLGQHRPGVADEEDVALSAFDSLCRGAAKGNFTRLTDRHDLWSLLLTMTSRKSVDRIRWENRRCRSGGKKLPAELPEAATQYTLDELIGRVPAPDFLLLMEEQCRGLLAQLRNDTLRDIVTWKLDGHTNTQIAQRLGISVHSVGRKLRMIRLAWTVELNALP